MFFIICRFSYTLNVPLKCPAGYDVPTATPRHTWLSNTVSMLILTVSIVRSHLSRGKGPLRGHFVRFFQSDILTFEMQRPNQYLIKITNQKGQEIVNLEIDGLSSQIDFSSFERGIYFITFKSKDNLITKKIIKL